MTTREEAIADFGRVSADNRLREAEMTPREQAEAAHTPGGPSVDELEARIVAVRNEAAAGTRTPTAREAP